MSRSFVLYTIFLITTLALGAPTERHLKGRSFEVERVRRSNYIPHGLSAIKKAYRKFNISSTSFGLEALEYEPIDTPKTATNAANAAQGGTGGNGAVSATATANDAEFVSPVSIGGQTVMMDFDTGSSDLWVFNSQLPAADQKGHTVFDTTTSTSFKMLQGETFSISYGDGSSASGNVGTDIVNIGGATVQTQAVELAKNVSGSFLSDTSSNGLVGFAFSKLNTVKPTQQKTFFDNVASSLALPVMTVSLKSGSNQGSYEFGKIDTAKFTGQITNVSVNSANGFWEFDSTLFKVGDSGAMQQITTAPTAIADTGTSLMLVAPEAAQAYYAQVQGAMQDQTAGGYVFPCGATLPSFSIAVGGQNLATVPATVLNFATVGKDTQTGQTFCYGGIQSSGANQFMIFGDVFLKSMFVVFDQRGPSLGLASPT
ncbi:pepsin-type protease [Talaromyces proteolyticus]|uniref:Pepsin-type protease n=1 Tax=Talaromyces proteolyticus TaxID=1131652 RepID=A0AAD4Q046_9EURO|nr:pepsin-type protease [Talaromyces proteolyticus]KAH8696651.1 pepsin-type protease [Talaromyces proteolyticus]